MLLAPVIFLIIGIICAFKNINLFFITFLSLCGLIIFFLKKDKPKKLELTKATLSILLLFLGYFSYINQQNNLIIFDNATIDKNICILGSIKSIQINQQSRFKICTTLDIDKIKVNEKWITTKGAIQIYSKFRPFCKIDDQVFLKDIKLKKINNADFKKYLTRINLNNTLFINKPIFKITKKSNFSLRQHLSNLKNNIFYSLKRKINKPTFNLFSSTFLGNKNDIKQDELNYKFANWGMPHLIARSGLHLWILIFIFQFTFLLLRNFIIKRLIIFVLITIFYFISWPAIPFTRALLTYAFFEFCNIFGIPYKTSHLFLITCCIIILSNPIQIFFLDFQLSFFITYILLWYSQNKNRKIKILKKENKIA